jgi:hypothetical protein
VVIKAAVVLEARSVLVQRRTMHRDPLSLPERKWLPAQFTD